MKQSVESDLHARLAAHLDWNLLRTFIAIVQYGGISRAAEQIHLTQPAVSHALKRLEVQLGCKLIDRTARRFEITQAGRLIYARAVDIHNQISRLGDVASADAKDVFGHIRLLFASGMKSRNLNDLLQDFHRKHPHVTIRIDVMPSAEIQALVQQGTASAGFCLLRRRPAELEARLFLRQIYGLYCGRSHALFGQTDVKQEELRQQNFVTFPSDQMGGVLSPLTIYREQHVFEGRVAAMSFNMHELIRLIEAGLGLGLLPRHIAADLVRDGSLWELPLESGIVPIDVHLIWNPSTQMREAEKVFLDFALERQASMTIEPET